MYVIHTRKKEGGLFITESAVFLGCFVVMA